MAISVLFQSLKLSIKQEDAANRPLQPIRTVTQEIVQENYKLIKKGY
jgi:hypothetical protein